MHSTTTPAGAGQITGQEHWTNKGSEVKLFLWEKCAGDPAKAVGTILFVHGSSMASTPTFDLQVPGRPEFVGHGLVRGQGLRLLVRGHGGLRPLHQDTRQQCTDRAGRRRLLRRRPLHPETPGPAPAPGLRNLVGRAARGALRRAASGVGGPPRARRYGVDRRRRPHPGAAAQAIARIHGERTAGRSTKPSSIRSSAATIPAPPRTASSRPTPTPSPHSTIRCPPAPMSTCAHGCP